MTLSMTKWDLGHEDGGLVIQLKYMGFVNDKMVNDKMGFGPGENGVSSMTNSKMGFRPGR